MYTVLGATGNTGSVVVKELLKAGKQVRAVGRDSKKLAPFVSRGVEAFVADVADAEALRRAFAGAEAVYTLIPPNVTADHVRDYQDQVTNAVAKAIEMAKVKYAVVLSSFGADKPDKTGPVVGLHYLESKLSKISGLNALFLRAGYFMENTLAQIGIIRSFGMMAGPVRADLPLPMIATRDIGAVAADALVRLDFHGPHTRELLGQRDVTYNQVARIAGTAIGKPAMAYIELPAEQVIQAMTGMGMSKNFATVICEMSDALNNGYMRPLEPRSAKNMTPTSFETFVQEVFLPAYKGQAASA
ncbi:MAG TPA: NAD(P)H-binding protein [Candidatus Acidoferrum sp.]|jgi:uncharacterized protein YbjT (DUF2867 family)|nr:NAD(P)H-binding protein [Candidatus Acidoferrum sp.]